MFIKVTNIDWDHVKDKGFPTEIELEFSDSYQGWRENINLDMQLENRIFHSLHEKYGHPPGAFTYEEVESKRFVIQRSYEVVDYVEIEATSEEKALEKAESQFREDNLFYAEENPHVKKITVKDFKCVTN